MYNCSIFKHRNTLYLIDGQHGWGTSRVWCNLQRGRWLWQVFIILLEMGDFKFLNEDTNQYNMTFCSRVANNGDTANKIGTYSLAVLAKHHKWKYHIRTIGLPTQCTMHPLSTKSCLKSSKLKPILNGQFCHGISKNVSLNGYKQPWEMLVFVIFKLQFRIICSCSNYLKYMGNFDHWSIF